jgi:hypothetical protein
MKNFAVKGGIWVIWPKISSGIEADLSQPIVRHTCTVAGYVDFKSCKVDDTWSGLKFCLKK